MREVWRFICKSLLVLRLPALCASYKLMVKHPFNIVEQVKQEPSDVLDRQKCLEALASLRHAKWFQV